LVQVEAAHLKDLFIECIETTNLPYLRVHCKVSTGWARIRWKLAMFIELIMFVLATAFVAATVLGHVLLVAAIVQCVLEDPTRGASASGAWTARRQWHDPLEDLIFQQCSSPRVNKGIDELATSAVGTERSSSPR
jgi:hypothetical protein